MYNRTDGYLYANWKGYVSIGQVKDGCISILGEKKKLKVINLINDNRELYGTWTQAIRWLDKDFMPLFVDMGLGKIAFIYSTDLSARYSLDRFLEVNDQYIAQTFESFESAENWLLEKNKSHTSSSTGSSISVRQGDLHHIIEIDNILYISCIEGKVAIHTKKQIIEVNHTLKDLLARFSEDRIIQIHKSYAVNLNEISAIKYYAGGSYHAYLNSLSKVRIPVGRKYAIDLKNKLGITS